MHSAANSEMRTNVIFQIRFISSFGFKENQIEQVRHLMPECEEGFFKWLATIDCSKLKVYAMLEGTLVFPRIPMIRVEGPLAVGLCSSRL